MISNCSTIEMHCFNSMDPSEKKLRDEVLYLHNLWYQGPPSNHTHQNPNSIPNSRFRKRRFDPPPVSGPEWPVQPQPSEETPAWPALKRHAPAAQPVSAEDQLRLIALKIQQKALDASREFLTKMEGSDSEEEGEESEDEVEDGSGEGEAHRFFMGVFVEDSELRSYYEKSHKGGEFYCLVCAGIGKKAWKRFKDCVGLIQHSTTISNTKKKLAHRAFGHAICKVLGWDIDRIPVIELKGQPLSRTLGVPQDSNALKENNSEAASNGSCETCLNTGELVSVGCIDSQELMEVDETMNGKNTEKSSLDMGANKVINCMGSEALEVTGITESHANEPLSAITIHQPSAEVKERPSLVLFDKALEACHIFFAANASSDELKDGGRIEECEEFKFLVKVFEEDDDLRRYHENDGEGGEFCCLLCGGERFKGCRALLQHAIAISKTEKVLAHRAYGHVICKVLAWDINAIG